MLYFKSMNGKHKILIIILAAFFTLGYSVHSVHALVKDSDVDG